MPKPNWTAKITLSLTKAVVKLGQGKKLEAALEATGIGTDRLDAWLKDRTTLNLSQEVLKAAQTKLAEKDYDEFPDEVIREANEVLHRGFSISGLYDHLDDPAKVVEKMRWLCPLPDRFGDANTRYLDLLLTEVVAQLIERIDRFPAFMRYVVHRTRNDSTAARAQREREAAYQRLQADGSSSNYQMAIEMIGSPQPTNSEKYIEDFLMARQAYQDAEFEETYSEALYEKLNRVELFVEQVGATARVQRKDNLLELSVAYVNLQLSSGGPPLSAASVLALPPNGPARKVIKGVAGSGKTTLLSWIALQTNQAVQAASPRIVSFDVDSDSIVKLLNRIWMETWWSDYVPFYIRLRDYADGNFPTKADFTKRITSEDPPDPQWVRRVFDSGRALVLIDGLDELSIELRPKAMEWVNELKLDDRSILIVTSRPQAIDDELAAGFEQYEIQELTPTSQREFLSNWHLAAAQQLKLSPEAAKDLDEKRETLQAELLKRPELAKLARNPLLCALLCAINRVYDGNLPTGLDELCSSAIRMLLWDRDKLQILSQDPAPKAYRELAPFEQRQEILEMIAYEFVTREAEILPSGTVLHIIKSSYGRRTDHEAEEILRGIVERSNLLRWVRGNELEFVHNTLRDFLAAHLLAETNDDKFLFGRVIWSVEQLDRWGPLFRFVVGSTSHRQFAQKVLRALLTEAPNRQAAFFDIFILGLANAYRGRLPVDIEDRIEAIRERYLPVDDLEKAKLMGASGPQCIQYLQYEPGYSPEIMGARARALVEIGTDEALEACRPYVFANYSPDGLDAFATSMRLEYFCKFRNGWEIPFIRRSVLSKAEEEDPLFIEPASYISDLSPLRDELPIEYLILNGCQVDDYSILRESTTCTYLNLSNSSFCDLAILEGFDQLRELNLNGADVASLEGLPYLPSLKRLVLSSVNRIRDISPLSRCPNLRSLDLSWTLARDQTVLKKLIYLTNLKLVEADSVDTRSISQLANLESIDLRATECGSFEFLAGLTKLKTLLVTKDDDTTALEALRPDIEIRRY